MVFCYSKLIKCIVFTLSAVFIFTNLTFSQTKTGIKKEINMIMQAARNGNNLSFKNEYISNKTEAWILGLIEPYYSDTIVMVRSKACDIAQMVGMQLADTITRRKVVNILVQTCKDKDSGISGKASQGLTDFNRNDFDSIAANNLVDLLKIHTAHYSTIIKLVGFVKPSNAEEVLLHHLTTDSALNATTRWAIHLALARMGNEEQINYCLNKVKSVAVNDDVVYDLLPDLVYIRQPETINYLVEILNSDEKNCTSSDPDRDEKIICGYRVMEYLPPLIKNFPLQVGASDDIKGYDYPEALEIARKWFEENKEYELITDLY